MELRHLRYFVAVAEELHFGRAAERLNISQPPLSRQIQDLEQELGFALFARDHHRVALTDAGKVFLTHAKQILEQVARAAQEAAEVAAGRSGSLRVGHGTHLPDGFLTRVLGGFQDAVPGIAIELIEAPSPRVVRALHDKSIDVAILLTPADVTGLVVRRLIREPMVVALPPDHPYASTPLADLSQLADENFVLCRRYEDPGYREIVEGICLQAGFRPRVRQAVENKNTVLDLVAKGLGVSLIQRSAATGRHDIRYVPLPTHVCLESVIAWRDDATHPSIPSFVEMAEREAAALSAFPDQVCAAS